jgi:hypothetical protein
MSKCRQSSNDGQLYSPCRINIHSCLSPLLALLLSLTLRGLPLLLFFKSIPALTHFWKRMHESHISPFLMHLPQGSDSIFVDSRLKKACEIMDLITIQYFIREGALCQNLEKFWFHKILTNFFAIPTILRLVSTSVMSFRKKYCNSGFYTLFLFWLAFNY